MYIIPGPAGPLLESDSCHGQSLVAELRWAGHDVLMVPVFTRIGGESADVPLFGEAIRVYARHIFGAGAGFVPEFLWRRLNRPAVWKTLSRRFSKSAEAFTDFVTDALSVNSGKLGAEAEDLCRWLARQNPADVVFLSSPFLLGIAPALKRALRIPVCCYMGGEAEDFTNFTGTSSPRILSRLRAAIAAPDRLVAASGFQAERLRRRLGAPASAVSVVSPGVECAAGAAEAVRMRAIANDAGACVVVHGAGTDALESAADYVNALRESGAGVDPELVVRRTIADGGADRKADARVRETLGGRVRMVYSSLETAKVLARGYSVVAFIHSKPYPAFDLSILYAMASGAAVVMPNTGACPEIAEMCSGTGLYDAEKGPSAFAEAVVRFSSDPERAAAAGRNNVDGVRKSFTVQFMGNQTAEILKRTISVAGFRGKRAVRSRGRANVPHSDGR